MYKMAEMELRVDHLTRLYELKDKDVQELIKRFGLVIKTLVNSLNVSVSNEVESLIVAYNKSIELFRSPIAHIDMLTFLPHSQYNKDYLRPLILHSGGRNSGIYLFHYILHIILNALSQYIIQTKLICMLFWYHSFIKLCNNIVYKCNYKCLRPMN